MILPLYLMDGGFEKIPGTSTKPFSVEYLSPAPVVIDFFWDVRVNP